jgi:spore coat protein U-like protein
VKWSSILLTIALALLSAEAWAQECTISTVGVQFGAYDTDQVSPLNASGEIDVSCDSGLAYTIRLGQGQNTGGGFFPRRMLEVGGGATMAYNLYRNASRTEVWGDGSSNTFVISGIGAGVISRHIIYARVPARQNVTTGRYEDVVAVLFEW